MFGARTVVAETGRPDATAGVAGGEEGTAATATPAPPEPTPSNDPADTETAKLLKRFMAPPATREPRGLKLCTNKAWGKVGLKWKNARKHVRIEHYVGGP